MSLSLCKTPWLSLGLCLSLAAPVIDLLQDQGPVQRSTPPIEGADAYGGERVEHFLIQWDSEAPHPGLGYDGSLNLAEALQRGELGLVELRRRAVNGEWQLEQEVQFPFEDVRLMAVERMGSSNPGLIWREIAGGAGRTIFAEWDRPGDELQVREWCSTGSARRVLHPTGPLRLPLAFLEAARTGDLKPGLHEVFDPLHGQLDAWQLEDVGLAANAAESPIRHLEFRRADGSLAGRYVFEGEALQSFQWQMGGFRMSRIPAHEYASRVRLWGLDPE